MTVTVTSKFVEAGWKSFGYAHVNWSHMHILFDTDSLMRSFILLFQGSHTKTGQLAAIKVMNVTEVGSRSRGFPLLHMLFLDHDIISIFRQH